MQEKLPLDLPHRRFALRCHHLCSHITIGKPDDSSLERDLSLVKPSLLGPGSDIDAQFEVVSRRMLAWNAFYQP